MPRFQDPAEISEFRRALQVGHDPHQPYVAICGGTGCLALGAAEVRHAFEEAIAKNGAEVKVRMKFTGCHGFCEKGPLVVIHPQEHLYVGVKAKDVPEILEKVVGQNGLVERLLYQDPATKERTARESDVPFYRHQKRLVFGMNGMIDPTSIDDYIRIGGYSALPKALFEMTPEQVIAEVKRAGLRGRGGGGFSAGTKWETCRKAHGNVRYVIINADEGDPGAYMDRSLLEGNPHSVLEGLIIGAYAISYGLSPVQGFIYVRHEYPLAVKYFTTAVEKAREYGLLGEDILGKDGFNFDVQISQGGGAFVCGESSALMASLEGKPGEPRAKYVHTVHKGLHNQPSNLNNVETWANVPLIVNNGADWYAAMGTEGSKGTKIFSLVGKINHTGLVEVPMGITLREIVYGIGGGIRENKQFKAVQTGGPSGGCLPESLLDLPVDFDALTKVGSMMGSGGMIVMDQDTCMVDVARYFLNFLKGESCGKCTPCREGIKQILHILDRICEGDGKDGDLQRLIDLGNAVQDTSLCALGGSAANPLLTTINYFEEEYLAHIHSKRCPAAVCRALIEYMIVAEKCTGCMACIKRCPKDGIAGVLKKPHFIDREKCIKCGICYETCNFDAVVRISVGV
jgi:NADH-quinone oxidoreductase subunit F